MQLMDLPDDLLGRIVGNLKVRGQACVARTNVRLREVVAETQRAKLAADSRRPGRISDELVPTFGELERHGVVLSELEVPTLRALAGPANAPKVGPLHRFYEATARFYELHATKFLQPFHYDKPPLPHEEPWATHLVSGTSQLDAQGLTTGFGLSLMTIGEPTTYLGYTKRGRPHGMGLLVVGSTSSPKSFYLGFWRNGRMHGRGEMRCGRTLKEGNWDSGQFVGPRAVKGEVDAWPCWSGLSERPLEEKPGTLFQRAIKFSRLLRVGRAP